MATTLATLRADTRIRAGINDPDALFTDAVLNSLINASLTEIAALADWPWLTTTENIVLVADQAAYAPAGAVTRVRYAHVVYADGATVKLEAWRRHDLDRFDAWTGCPVAFSVEGSTVHITPAPVAGDLPATVVLGTVVSEPKLTTDASAPLMPDAYVDALVVCAAHKCAVRASDSAMQAALAAEKATWWQALKDQVNKGMAAPRVRIEREWYG